MIYIGNKRKIADMIINNIPYRKYFVEPFAGGFNVCEFVHRRNQSLFPVCEQIWLNEMNKYIVALVLKYKEGWTIYSDDHPEIYEHPHEKFGPIKGKRVSLELFNDICDNPDAHPDHLVGFVKNCCTFRSMWTTRTYAVIDETLQKNIDAGRIGNRTLSGHRNIMRCIDKIHFDKVTIGSYDEMELPPPAETNIYCDPPYKGTVGYKDKFDHDAYYQWCIDRRAEGYNMFMSEYYMPEPFVEIDKYVVHTEMNRQTDNIKRLEKLYILS